MEDNLNIRISNATGFLVYFCLLQFYEEKVIVLKG